MSDVRVLVLMPTARDGERTRVALETGGLAAEVCADVGELCREIGAGAGAALLTEESLLRGRRQLRESLRAQPAWSDFPLVVLAREGAGGRGLELREAMNATLVERPVKIRSLLSVVRAALRSRRHQYAVRDHLAEWARAQATQAYLVRLGDALRPLSGPVEVQAAASRLLGEHLGTNRVAYFEIAGDEYVVERDYASGVASLAGRYPTASFGAALLKAFLAGRTVVEADATTQPGRPEGERAAFAAIDVRGHVDVPLVKGGTFVAGMTVHLRDARGWTTEEVALIEQTAERTWEAVERARAERAVRVGEERFRTLFEAMDEGYCVVEPVCDGAGRPVDYRYVLANPALEDHTGLREVVGKTARQVMPGHEAHWIEAYARVAETGESFHRTGRAADLGRWYDVSAFPVGGGLVGVLFADVTARKQAEQDLRERDDRLQLAVAIARMGTFEVDLASDAVTVNEPGRDIYGWADTRTTFARVQTHFHTDDRDAVMGRVSAALDPAGAGVFEVEQRIVRTDGAVRWLRVRGRALFDSGCAVLLVGAYLDVTDQKEAEAALRDQDRKKDDFIALLAHELRNPLAPVRNGVQVLKLSGRGEDRAVAMMDRQLTHMVRLIDDLLDVSRINRNKMELRLARVSLADVVASAVETARPALDAAGHDFSVTLPSSPVVLDADLTRLAQVFSNLLTNSAKYTPRGGRVWLLAERTGGRAVVVVKDTGIGIPPMSLPTIFDMFSQVDRSVEKTTGGLGIGLALVKGLVEMHGGSVTAASDGDGAGTTFTVTLPVAEPGESEGATASNEPARVSTRRILVVDDNRDGAESMGDLLGLLGHEVTTAHDGLEAIERAATYRPDVILMDIGMPRLNGLDATRRIRGEDWGKGIAIIAVTGWGQENDRDKSREAGCDAHLVKPVNVTDLQQVLAEVAN